MSSEKFNSEYFKKLENKGFKSEDAKKLLQKLYIDLVCVNELSERRTDNKFKSYIFDENKGEFLGSSDVSEYEINKGFFISENNEFYKLINLDDFFYQNSKQKYYKKLGDKQRYFDKKGYTKLDSIDILYHYNARNKGTKVKNVYFIKEPNKIIKEDAIIKFFRKPKLNTYGIEYKKYCKVDLHKKSTIFFVSKGKIIYLKKSSKKEMLRKLNNSQELTLNDLKKFNDYKKNAFKIFYKGIEKRQDINYPYIYIYSDINIIEDISDFVKNKNEDIVFVSECNIYKPKKNIKKNIIFYETEKSKYITFANKSQVKIDEIFDSREYTESEVKAIYFQKKYTIYEKIIKIKYKSLSSINIQVYKSYCKEKIKLDDNSFIYLYFYPYLKTLKDKNIGKNSFHILNLRDDKKDYNFYAKLLYRLRNAIAHMEIKIENEELVFKNTKSKDIVLKGKIDISLIDIFIKKLLDELEVMN